MENTDATGSSAPEVGGGQRAADADLEERFNVARDELKAAKDEQLRLLAEMDNQRKRMARDVEAARRYGAERLIHSLLPVIDSLERGLTEGSADPARLRPGMELTLKLLSKALADHGVVVLDPLGQAFDPQSHQAMSVVESGQHDPGSVAGVLQKGYRLNERLLRPALVAVAQEPPPPEDG